MKQYRITTNIESLGDITIPDAYIDDKDAAKQMGGVPGLSGLPPFFRTTLVDENKNNNK